MVTGSRDLTRGFGGITAGCVASNAVAFANWKMAIEIVDLAMGKWRFEWENHRKMEVYPLVMSK